jgi:hypothetical protein
VTPSVFANRRESQPPDIAQSFSVRALKRLLQQPPLDRAPAGVDEALRPRAAVADKDRVGRQISVGAVTKRQGGLAATILVESAVKSLSVERIEASAEIGTPIASSCAQKTCAWRT